MELHEKSGSTFSLVSHYLKKTGRSPFGLLEIEQVCSHSFSSLRTVRTPLKAFWKFRQTLLTTSHLATFPASRNFRLSFIETIHQGHPLQKSILPFTFYECACPTYKFALTRQLSSDPQTLTPTFNTPSHTFLPKDIFFIRETNFFLVNAYISPNK